MQDGNSEAKAVRDRLKLEIAEEIGLLHKIKTKGWTSLSAAEAGRIGGILGKRLKSKKEE